MSGYKSGFSILLVDCFLPITALRVGAFTPNPSAIDAGKLRAGAAVYDKPACSGNIKHHKKQILKTSIRDFKTRFLHDCKNNFYGANGLQRSPSLYAEFSGRIFSRMKAEQFITVSPRSSKKSIAWLN